MTKTCLRTMVIAVLLTAVLLPGLVKAQKIYVVLAGDTSQRGGIALSTGPDLGFMYDAFYAHVPERQLVIYHGHVGMNVETDNETPNDRKAWNGPDIRGDLGDMQNKLLKIIQNCPAGPNDTIVFFYTGHGGYDKKQGHCLRMPDQKTILSRRRIVEQIQKKNPRLAVVITDSCNTLIERPVAPLGLPKIMPPEKISPLFESLFLKPRGLVDLNSASEDQVAVGPIGGGLLVLSMAYMGNQPDFHEEMSVRGMTIETIGAPDAAIPPVDFFRVLMRNFQWGEHGPTSGGFNLNLPQYGVLWAKANKRLSWTGFQREVTCKVDKLFQKLRRKGMVVQDGTGQPQQTQTPQFYALPGRPRAGGQPIANNMPGIITLQRGDIILAINDHMVCNTDDFWHEVKRSPPRMTFTIRRASTRHVMYLSAQLRGGRGSRFGVNAKDINDCGVQVIDVSPGSPGSCAKILNVVKKPIRLQSGDIILSINGQPIDDTNDYYNAVKTSAPCSIA